MVAIFVVLRIQIFTKQILCNEKALDLYAERAGANLVQVTRNGGWSSLSFITTVVDMVMNIGFIKMRRISWLAEETLAIKDFNKVSPLSLQ